MDAIAHITSSYYPLYYPYSRVITHSPPLRRRPAPLAPNPACRLLLA